MSKRLMVGLVLGLAATMAYAVPDSGLIDFDDTTPGTLTKQINTDGNEYWTYDVSTGEIDPVTLVMSDYDPNKTGQEMQGDYPGDHGFRGMYLVPDRAGDGTGDVFGDVSVSYNHQAVAGDSRFQAVNARIQEDTFASYGMWAPFFMPATAIVYRMNSTGNGACQPGDVRATSDGLWDGDGTEVVMNYGTWYNYALDVTGYVVSGTLTELQNDGSGNLIPVTGHVDTVSYDFGTDPGEFGDALLPTGFIGINPSGNTQTEYIDDFAWDGDLIPPSQPLAGDLNGDDLVGGDDLNIVLGSWGQNVEAGNWLLGDPSGDGLVAGDDLNIVLGNWGATPSMDIPEPATMSLLAIGALGLLRRRRQA